MSCPSASRRARCSGLLGPNGAGARRPRCACSWGSSPPTRARSASSGRPSGPAPRCCPGSGRSSRARASCRTLGRANSTCTGRPPAARRGRAHRRGPGDRRSRGRARPGRADVLPGHAAAARHRPGHARHAGPPDPRRADQRARPAADPRDAGRDDPVRGRGPDRHRLQPPPLGGRAVLHAPGRHGPGPARPGRSGRRDHGVRRHDPGDHGRRGVRTARGEGRRPARHRLRRPHRRRARAPRPTWTGPPPRGSSPTWSGSTSRSPASDRTAAWRTPSSP